MIHLASFALLAAPPRNTANRSGVCQPTNAPLPWRGPVLRCRFLAPLLLAGLLPIAALSQENPPPAAGSAATIGTASVDPRRDPRLAQRVTIRAEGVPLTHVLTALGQRIGVTLEVVGRPAGERVIAFVPEAPAAEVMLALADLHRLTWVRETREAGPVYRLLKTPAAASLESDLRLRSLRAMVEKASQPEARAARTPREALFDRHNSAVRGALRTLTGDQWRQLLAGRPLTAPLRSLPEASRRAITESMEPILRQLDMEVDRAYAAIREKYVAEGREVPARLNQLQHSKRPNETEYQLEVEIRQMRQPELWVRMETPDGTGYTPLILSCERALPGTGEVLYADRGIRLRTGVPATEPPSDGLFGKPVPARPPLKELPTAGWKSTLAELSTLTGLPFYSDDYIDELEHRGSFRVLPRPDQTLGSFLDSLASPGAYASAGFWWRRGNAILFRSRSWLWESEKVSAPAPSSPMDERFRLELVQR